MKALGPSRTWKTLICRVFAPLSLIVLLAPAIAHSQENREVFPDGVEHWYLTEPPNGESNLARKFKKICEAVSIGKCTQPFGKSIAFLIGIGAYSDLPPLPSVHNDVIQMREFLLGIGGFDEVYIATDKVVDRDIIEQYVKEKITSKMKPNDRLLFYYSGHGGDYKGKTGYMLFGDARRGQFWGRQVLEIDALRRWSQELPIQHMLFILDSCASGLAITSKSPLSESSKLLIETLSGNGSRTLLTAGTADEATYTLDDRKSTGNGAFTRAFLNAFQSRMSTDPSAGFITITDLFADVQREMASFRIRYGKSTHPQMWTLQESEYRGTFVFLNPRSTSPVLTDEQAKVLGVTLRPKRQVDTSADTASGVIEVSSPHYGALYLDDQPVGYMIGGKVRQLLQQAPGEHRVRMEAPVRVSETEVRMGNESITIMVENGKISYVAFGSKSPIDDSGTVVVGALVIESTQKLDGEVLVDDFRVGHLEKNGQLTVAHLTAGEHFYRILGAKESERGTVTIKPNETEYVIHHPNPPTGLTAVVR